jgi:thymidylate synthase (FAD)
LTKINVLDHGYVRLVDWMGDDLSIVRSARNSYDADWRAGMDHGSDARLIRYLWKNHHTTPFEAVEFQFEVKAPLFVFRQWHRHRTWTYNEVSARYTELPNEMFVPEVEDIGAQSTDNKQARTYAVPSLNRWLQVKLVKGWLWATYQVYLFLLWCGWPRELARIILPLAIYSRMFAKVDLLNLLKFLTLRSHTHAQKEIRVYAEAMLELIRPHVPETIAAWEEGKLELWTKTPPDQS